MIRKQETAPLILQMLEVPCSHKFVKVKMPNNANRLDTEELIDGTKDETLRSNNDTEQLGK